MPSGRLYETPAHCSLVTAEARLLKPEAPHLIRTPKWARARAERKNYFNVALNITDLTATSSTAPEILKLPCIVSLDLNVPFAPLYSGLT
jgi:hypothetical protein